ncbi:MAG: LexA repressor [Parcubacteria group bacterium GW2011_GWA2_51_10]|nr:MAG: LexA repressor [Parcubacteria group bacterium GW2011_GWA2_51_10]
MYQTYKERIVAFYHKSGRLPGYKEIMGLTGFRSKNAVFKLLERLIAEGLVSKDNSGHLIPRAIKGSTRLLGLVEAGFPSPAEEELMDVMDFDEYLTPNKEASYILKVKGDSMIDAGIHPGDMVIVERRATYKPGQIVIASIDNEYTMKYLRKKSGKYFLEPANVKYKPIYPTENFRVEAVVTAVVRKY